MLAQRALSAEDGILQLRWYDGKRYRIATFYIGESGVEPNVKYRVDELGQLVRIDPPAKAEG